MTLICAVMQYKNGSVDASIHLDLPGNKLRCPHKFLATIINAQPQLGLHPHTLHPALHIAKRVIHKWILCIHMNEWILKHMVDYHCVIELNQMVD